MGATNRHNAPADIAGASSGTGLVSLINLIPEQHATVKTLALYAAPVFAIAVRYIWVFLDYRINSYLVNKAFRTALEDSRKLRDQVLGNPNSTQKHRQDMQQQVEKLERLYMDSKADDLKTVRVKLKEM